MRRRRQGLLQAEDSSIWRFLPGLVEEIGERRGIWFPEHRVSIAAVRPKILLGVLRDGENLLSITPPKENGSRGTGTPTFTPTIPVEASRATRSAKAPFEVKTLHALP